MRVTTAFKRLLRLPGASVVDVSFGAEGVIVTVRLRRRRRVCSACGQTGRQLEIHDRRVKRWRHLDLGASRCVIECELRLLRCRDLRRAMEPVPWARPGAAAHARLRGRRRVAGPADGQDADRRAAQDRLGHGRADRRARDRRPPRRAPPRGPGLHRRRRDQLPPPSPLPDQRRRPPHGRDRVVPRRAATAPPCRRSSTSSATRKDSIRAVSIDMSGEYQRAIRDAIPDAEICFDPFHVCRLGDARDRPGPPRRMERPRALPHPDRPLGQGHPLVAAQGARTPDRSASSPRSARSSRPTARSTAPSCCAKSCGCSTTSTTRAWRRRTWTPGWPGPSAPGCGRSSASRAPSRATATASSPPSASASPTAASKASTARSA